MAHPDLDEIANVLLDFARQMLAQHGEFFPFAASMQPDGQIAHIAADVGKERPRSQEVLDVLYGSLSAQAAQGEIRAAGVCVDVRTIPPSTSAKVDAICVHLEHADGAVLEVFLPYIPATSGAPEYGEIFATRATCQIFGGGRQTH